jgi:O-antigen biosynthesis protein
MNKEDKQLLPPDLYSRNTVIAHLARILKGDEEMRVLDVGGRGARLSWFFPESAKFTILDLAPKTEDDEDDKIIEYKQGNAQKIPFSDNSFDIVVSTDMLEHMDKPFRAPAIREMLRVSKKYLILGVPCGNGLIGKAEEFVSNQYKDITGREHPFLHEHTFYGLPEETKIEEILNREEVQFLKVKEGNLMSWYIQQLYAGTQHEQDITKKKYGFYKYFNENLFELGNLRTPTYRTIFCIAKEGELKSDEILDEVQSLHKWDPEKYMVLLERAFKDLRMVINDKKTKLDELEVAYEHKKNHVDVLEQNHNRIKKEFEEAHARFERNEELVKEQEATIGKARKSLQLLKNALGEAKDYILEKESAIRLLKSTLHEVNNKINTLEQGNSNLQRKLTIQTETNSRLSEELNDLTGEAALLRNHIKQSERTVIEKNHTIEGYQNQLRAVTEDLENHRKAMKEVTESRAWKLVMFYSKIKYGLILNPYKETKKGWRILTRLGPKVFFQRLIRKIRKNPKLQVDQQPYDKYVEATVLNGKDKREALKAIEKFQYKPVISIVMPVYNVDEKWLVKAVESVRKQWYGKFELCICDDASTNEDVKKVLNKYKDQDARIKVVFRQHNGGIVKASNDALKLATGGYVAFLDNDDELTQNALYEVVNALQETKYDLVYSDEDKIDLEGGRSEPFFKPDWSPDLLLSHNYICHFAVYRRKIINEIEGLREGYDGSQDYDLLLRFTEKTENIKHIPKVLYHWRKVPGSAAAEVDAKPYAFDSAKKALEQALKRRKIEGEILNGIWKGSYRVKRQINEEPLVSIIIPFKDRVDLLKNCIESIRQKTTYKNYELILVDNRSELLSTQDYLKTIKNDPDILILKYNQQFNFSAINNMAAKQAKGEILMMLNNDTEIITPEWIEMMLEHVCRPEVGAVGAKLIFPDNNIQHAGVLIGVGGVANSAFLKESKYDNCYFGQANVIKNYSAVTGACMMVRKDVFFKIGGLNSDDLAVTFNDIDFCLRLREKGYLIVYTPYAKLYHHESISRGYDVDMDEVKFMHRKHAGILHAGDPYYNPNLSLERMDFSLRVQDKLQTG